jgi:hypothetical protein
MAPFPKFIGALAVVIAALAGVGHDTLATLFGAWGAAAIPVAAAVLAALSHSLTGTGGK